MPAHVQAVENPGPLFLHPSARIEAMNDDDEINKAKVRLYVALINVPPEQLTHIEAELMLVWSEPFGLDSMGSHD